MNNRAKTGIALLTVLLMALPLAGVPVRENGDRAAAGDDQQASMIVSSILTAVRDWPPEALLTKPWTALSSANAALKSKYCLSMTGAGFEPVNIGL